MRARSLMLAALILAYIVAFIDRQIPTLMVEPIKAALGLSDVEISLLYGLSFAIMISAAGAPAGLLVDRRRRVTLVAAGIALSSAMTSVSAFGAGFAELLACRALIGCGQAVLTPAAHSLIADNFPPHRLGLATGIFGVAPYLGTGIAYLSGSAAIAFVAHRPELFPAMQPWRTVLLLAGLAGLPLALLLFALPEGRRGAGPSRSGEAQWSRIMDFFLRHGGSFLLLKLATALASMALYAVAAWYPTLLIRHFHWNASQAGAVMGLLMAVAGTIGTIGGGMLGDRASRGHVSGRLGVMAVAALLAAPCAMAAPLVEDAVTGLGLLAAAMLLMAAVLGINPSATIAMMPPDMRGLGSGLGLLIVNLIGFGLGPTAIAGATDYGFGDPALLHYSLGALLPVMLLASTIGAVLAIRPYGRSVTARIGAALTA